MKLPYTGKVYRLASLRQRIVKGLEKKLRVQAVGEKRLG